MRCKACDDPISLRTNVLTGELEDLCLKCRRASRITSDRESLEESETLDLQQLLFGNQKRRSEE